MPYLHESQPPQYVIDAAVAAVRAAIDNAARLGLTWRIVPASVVGRGMSDPMATHVVLDGDGTSVRAVSMVGALASGQRAWCVQVPPGGLYVIGVIGPSMTLPTLQAFTASGTWTKPPGLAYVEALVAAAGGGSGGAPTTAAGQASMGGGGGGGATGWVRIPASMLPPTVPITVGAGGTAGAATAAAVGGTGGTSSFGSLLTAAGGAGGVARAPSAVMHGIDGGAGSNTLGGTLAAEALLFSGGAGGTGWGGDNGLAISGTGGSSHLGGGGLARRTTSAGQGLGGNAGRQFGGGASGSVNSGSTAGRVGAVGAAGTVRIQEYY